MSRKVKKFKYNYLALKGYIYSNPNTKNVKGFGKAIGISQSFISRKLCNASEFTQSDICLIIKTFHLTPEQVVEFFFTVEEEL